MAEEIEDIVARSLITPQQRLAPAGEVTLIVTADCTLPATSTSLGAFSLEVAYLAVVDGAMWKLDWEYGSLGVGGSEFIPRRNRGTGRRRPVGLHQGSQLRAAEATYKLNLPPRTFIRVGHAPLRRFAAALARGAGLVEERAALLADLLVANDLRGVFQPRYAATGGVRAGVARRPRSTPTRWSPVLPRKRRPAWCWTATAGWATSRPGRARCAPSTRRGSWAVCVLQTRNHGHIGAAGIYARLPLEHDMVALVTSAARTRPAARASRSTRRAIGSPLAFAAPAGAAAPLVVDFAPVYDLRISPRWAELAEWIPGTIFRCIGLGTVAQVWGGLLAGLPAAGGPARPRRFRGAAQSALVIMFRIDLFLEPAEFRAQMDPAGAAAQGAGAAWRASTAPATPATSSGQREREFRRLGIPLGPEHRSELEGTAWGTGNRRALESGYRPVAPRDSPQQVYWTPGASDGRMVT